MDSFLSVIIPTFKDWQRLELCLDALNVQVLPRDKFEIIVVNNDPNHLSSLDGRYLEEVTLLQEGKPGSYAARNTGIKHAKGDILVFTDSDCIPQPNWLKNLYEKFLLDPGVQRIGGKVEILLSDQPKPSEWFDRIFAFQQKRNVSEGFSVTANFACRKALFEENGMFWDNVFSGEDRGWNLRVSQAGVPLIYAEDCVVLHPARSKEESLIKVRRIYGKNYQRKHKSKPVWQRLVNGLFQLRPPITEWGVAANSPLIKGNFNKVLLLVFIYQRRLTEFQEHYRLLFGGNEIRT
ncbi:glycosyltransferase family 2 protein [Pleomorphovibrio marinus]|uniref:glycosyltransferase family 2 protein n=1 Tax=Pleomorphovibrio marinus TaxID=2164132 RepID=UPI000E0B5689|nr:glycosyltransferase [Pleomorphovibrio marinus]